MEKVGKIWIVWLWLRALVGALILSLYTQSDEMKSGRAQWHSTSTQEALGLTASTTTMRALSIKE